MIGRVWQVGLLLLLFSSLSCSAAVAPTPVASTDTGGPVWLLDTSCPDDRIVASARVGPFYNLMVWDLPDEPRVFDGSPDKNYTLQVLRCTQGYLTGASYREAPTVVDLATGEIESKPEVGELVDVYRSQSGQTYALKDGALFHWVDDAKSPLKQLTDTNFIAESPEVDLAVSENYVVVGKLPSSGDGVLFEAWLLADSMVSQPSVTHLYEGGRIVRSTITEGNRFIGVGDDKLFIWDVDSGETTTVDSVDASYYVFVLENGLIVTSGRKGRLEPIDPDKPQVTRFWDPETLEEVRSIEGLRITRAAPMSEGRVAFAIELDDTEATRGDQGSHYRIEVWNLDEIAEG